MVTDVKKRTDVEPAGSVSVEVRNGLIWVTVELEDGRRLRRPLGVDIIERLRPDIEALAQQLFEKAYDPETMWSSSAGPLPWAQM